jgi:Uma2 family endonuclease
MSALALKLNTAPHFTYKEYETWPEYPRFEIIYGEAIEMSSPTEVHQRISGELFFQLKLFLRGKEPRIYYAPFDVRLNHKTADNIIVQPDIIVVNDPSKIENGKSCMGAPDLVVEILSDSTQSHDKVRKFNIYMEAGVREYWIIHPSTQIVEVNILENEKYHITPYSAEDTIPVHILEGCTINLKEIFNNQSE